MEGGEFRQESNREERRDEETLRRSARKAVNTKGGEDTSEAETSASDRDGKKEKRELMSERDFKREIANRERSERLVKNLKRFAYLLMLIALLYILFNLRPYLPF